MKKFHRKTILTADQELIVALNQLIPEFSKTQLKEVISSGQVWVNKKLVKRNTKILNSGDLLEVYYLALSAEDKVKINSVRILYQEKDIAVVYKPVNILSQSSPWGDRMSLPKIVAHLLKIHEVFLIQRLDREVRGLMVVALNPRAVPKLQNFKKIYHAYVLGVPPLDEGIIENKLDGKAAKTTYKVLRTDTPSNKSCFSLLEIELHTGRFHQIRRHLNSLGCPIMGDPLYGKENNDARGLQLVAKELSFEFNCHKFQFNLENVDVPFSMDQEFLQATSSII